MTEVSPFEISEVITKANNACANLELKSKSGNTLSSPKPFKSRITFEELF